MKLGVYPVLAGNGGGIYQYSLSLLRALEEDARANLQLTLFTDVPEAEVATRISLDVWRIRRAAPPSHAPELLPEPVGSLRRLYRRTPLTAVGRRVRERQARRGVVRDARALLDRGEVSGRPDLHRWFDVDLMLYPMPTAVSFEASVPFMMAIHDVQHRLQPRFPEVSRHGESTTREYVFRNAARRAELLLADSEVGKEDLLDCYGAHGLAADRVAVLPFCVPPYLGTADASQAPGLPEDFLFYPAQFWPHKNHVNLVAALGILRREYGLMPLLVLCGSKRDALRQRTFAAMQRRARREGVLEQVRYLGFLPDEAMPALYRRAAALVMPTFFGPTNIPVLEAWTFGCPVITSDIRGIREQANGAAELVDPTAPAAIAAGVARVLTDSARRHELTIRGRTEVEQYSFDRFAERLGSILDTALDRVDRRRAASA